MKRWLRGLVLVVFGLAGGWSGWGAGPAQAEVQTPEVAGTQERLVVFEAFLSQT